MSKTVGFFKFEFSLFPTENLFSGMCSQPFDGGYFLMVPILSRHFCIGTEFLTPQLVLISAYVFLL